MTEAVKTTPTEDQLFSACRDAIDKILAGTGLEYIFITRPAGEFTGEHALVSSLSRAQLVETLRFACNCEESAIGGDDDLPLL